MPKMTAYRAIYPGPRRQTNVSAPSRTERGAMAYSEITDGTVAEYEAIQSTVMNRIASRQKSWVAKDKRDQPLNEDNVITAPHQYQGVGGTNYERYITEKDNNRGTRNAEQADRNLSRTGRPTSDAVSFIVHQDGSPPTDEEIMRLGPNLDPHYEKIGRVYLYKLKQSENKNR